MNSSSFFFIFLIKLIILSSVKANLFYCSDWDCKEPISTGKTLQVYSAPTNRHISFGRNDDIKILSKPSEESKDGLGDWVAECRGRVGLVPKSMVREHKIHKVVHKYQFPLDSLPIWKEQESADEEEVVIPEQVEEQPQEEEESIEKKNESDALNDDDAVGEDLAPQREQEKENTSESTQQVELLDSQQQQNAAQDTVLNQDNIDSNNSESVVSPTPSPPPQETDPEVEASPKTDESLPINEEIVSVVSSTSSSSSSSSSDQNQNVEPSTQELNPEVKSSQQEDDEQRKEKPVVEEEKKESSDSYTIPQKSSIELEEAFPFEPEPEEDDEQEVVVKKETATPEESKNEEKPVEEQQTEAEKPIEASIETTEEEKEKPSPSESEQIEPSGIFSAINSFSTKIMSNLLPEDLQDGNENATTTTNTEDTDKPKEESPWFNQENNNVDSGENPGRRRAWSSLEPKLKSAEPQDQVAVEDNVRLKRSLEANENQIDSQTGQVESEKVDENNNVEPQQQQQSIEKESSTVPEVIEHVSEEEPQKLEQQQQEEEAQPEPSVPTSQEDKEEVEKQEEEEPKIDSTETPTTIEEAITTTTEEPGIPSNENENENKIEEPTVTEAPSQDDFISGLARDSDEDNSNSLPEPEEGALNISNTDTNNDDNIAQEIDPQVVIPPSELPPSPAIETEIIQSEPEPEPTHIIDNTNNNNQSPSASEPELASIPSLSESGNEPFTNVNLESVGVGVGKEPEILIPDLPSTPPPTIQSDLETEPQVKVEHQVTFENVQKTPPPPTVETAQQQQQQQDGEVSSSSSHDSHDHSHSHSHHHHHHHHDFKKYNSSSSSSIVTVIRHLSATLLSFLPEALQDSILDVNDAQIFTGIIALTLVSICVPYFFIETVLAMRPLKKQVEELSNSLWKSKTAYEIQLEEFEGYKKKALAHDEKQKRIEQLENELVVANKLLSKQKEQIKLLQKELKVTSRAATNFESVMEGTRKKKDEAMAERDALLRNIHELQEALKSNVAEYEDARSEAQFMTEQLEQATHEKETLKKLLKKSETTLELAKTKTLNEAELRRQSEETVMTLRAEIESIKEELGTVKSICEQYEKTTSELSEEVMGKENELLALKETLGEDSPLIEIAEAKARTVTAEEESKTMRKRVETMSIEISSLSRNYDETKSELTKVKTDKEAAENRLEVLETWFKKQEDELRATVEKYETERNIRGKDESELIKLIHEKDDELKQLQATIEALKAEIEEIKTANRNEIRNLEGRIGDNFLQMCQSERKINEARKEAELLRQKLASVVRQGDDTAGGDVPLYSSLPPDMQPLPPLPDDLPPMSMNMPSYFGMGGLELDPLPPLPLGAADNIGNLNRPPPLGRISTTPPYNNYGDDGPGSPIAPPHDHHYSNYSSRSNSPLDHMRPGSRDNWMNDNDNRSDRDRDNRSNQHHLRNNNHNNNNNRGPIPNSTSSPIPHPHGINL